MLFAGWPTDRRSPFWRKAVRAPAGRRPFPSSPLSASPFPSLCPIPLVPLSVPGVAVTSYQGLDALTAHAQTAGGRSGRVALPGPGAPLCPAALQVGYGGPLSELDRPKADDPASEAIGFGVAAVVLLIGFGSVYRLLRPAGLRNGRVATCAPPRPVSAGFGRLDGMAVRRVRH